MKKNTTKREKRAMPKGPNEELAEILFRLRQLRVYFVDSNHTSDYRRISHPYDGVAVQFWVGANTLE